MKEDIDKLKKDCINQNRLLVKKKLIFQSFGNVSLRINEELFLIKPSGIDLSKLTISDIPIIRIKDGKQINKAKLPSVDTPTHTEIYKNNNSIVSIAHTHSVYATSWAQAGKDIPNLGTTSADYFKTKIPIVKYKKKIFKNYEKDVGILISEKLKQEKYLLPGLLLHSHGVFSFGTSKEAAVLNAELIEFIAQIAYLSVNIKVKEKFSKSISSYHFNRKHGKNSYYGQKKK